MTSEATYEPQDAFIPTLKGIGGCGFGGLAIAATRNTLARGNVGAFGVFSRFGGTIALFGMHPPRYYIRRID